MSPTRYNDLVKSWDMVWKLLTFIYISVKVLCSMFQQISFSQRMYSLLTIVYAKLSLKSKKINWFKRKLSKLIYYAISNCRDHNTFHFDANIIIIIKLSQSVDQLEQQGSSLDQWDRLEVIDKHPANKNTNILFLT